MFASLIIVVPSLALPQAEYYHPGRALFQVQVAQGLFQFHSVGHHYPGPPEQVSNLWLQCFQRHHILSGRQLRVIMYYPPLHLLRSVLDYLPCSKITGGCFFLRRTKCLLDFIVHMALIIAVSTAEWILAQISGQYSFAQGLLHRCTWLRAASRACRQFVHLGRSFIQVSLFSFLLLQICFSSYRSWAWLIHEPHPWSNPILLGLFQ